MPCIFRHLRCSLVALAAIFASSLTAGDASACSAMERGRGACESACGCCTTGAEHDPVDRGEVMPIPALASCETAPGGGCSCLAQRPVPPAPKPSRATDEGHPGPGPLFVRNGDGSAARGLPTGRVMAPQAPPKTPLYLRNARLLF